jgi:hypothetical protein
LPQYEAALIDARAAVNESARRLPDGELERELEAAIQAYADARELGDRMWEPGDTTLASRMVERYGARRVPVSGTREWFVPATGVRLKMLSAAEEHTERAARLLGR